MYIDASIFIFWIILTRKIYMYLKIGNTCQFINIKKVFFCLRSYIENFLSQRRTCEKCYNRRKSCSCSNTYTKSIRILKKKFSIRSCDFYLLSYIQKKNCFASSSIFLQLYGKSNASISILDDRI